MRLGGLYDAWPPHGILQVVERRGVRAVSGSVPLVIIDVLQFAFLRHISCKSKQRSLLNKERGKKKKKKEIKQRKKRTPLRSIGNTGFAILRLNEQQDRIEYNDKIYLSFLQIELTDVHIRAVLVIRRRANGRGKGELILDIVRPATGRLPMRPKSARADVLLVATLAGVRPFVRV